MVGRKVYQAAFQSWKTTLAGFMTMVVLAWDQLRFLVDTDTATQPDWNIVVGAVLAFVLGLVSRDNDVNSKKAGAE